MKRKLIVPVLLAAAVSLSACATKQDGSSATTSTSSGIRKVTVGAIAVAGDAPLVVAQKEGIFAKHGLEVTIQPGQNFGAVLPLVQNGELQIGFSSAIPLLNASARGANLQIIQTQEFTDTDPATASIVVMVPGNSTMTSAKDLSGKKVGVVAKGNSDSLALLAAVKKSGGDPSKVQFLELGIGPSLLQGLQNGNVDAIVGGEPTRTKGLAGGAKVLFYPQVEGIPGLPQSGYFTTAAFAKANKQTVKEFVAAMVDASDYALKNPEKARAVLPDFLKIDASLANQVRLPQWNTTTKPEDWQSLANVGSTFGILPPDVKVTNVGLS